MHRVWKLLLRVKRPPARTPVRAKKGTGHNEATGIVCIIYYVQRMQRKTPIELRGYEVWKNYLRHQQTCYVRRAEDKQVKQSASECA